MNDMIPILRTTDPADRARIDAMLHKLRLDPADLAAGGGPYQKEIDSVQQILSDVARRGDQALVDVAVKFDDPKFTAAQIRVSPEEMKQAAGRVPPAQMEALRRSIDNVRAYQSLISCIRVVLRLRWWRTGFSVMTQTSTVTSFSTPSSALP